MSKCCSKGSWLGKHAACQTWRLHLVGHPRLTACACWSGLLHAEGCSHSLRSVLWVQHESFAPKEA